MVEPISFDISVIIVMVIMFIFAPILQIIKMYYMKKWKKDLIDFEIASEVINIYREHKHIESQKEWFLFKSIENLKHRIRDYFNTRKQKKSDKKNYGI